MPMRSLEPGTDGWLNRDTIEWALAYAALALVCLTVVAGLWHPVEGKNVCQLR